MWGPLAYLEIFIVGFIITVCIMQPLLVCARRACLDDCWTSPRPRHML